ncbi:MAG TPA: 5'-nucleotidase C-terminal domain-containing protein [Gemmatimonadales bacterium]|nr:5'-nucleotidase C-terminal domain-containing protein [Gemmatimonadales bacterium]
MLASLLLAAALTVPHPAAPDTAHLVIVATTDVHGRAFAWDYTTDRPFPGGLTRVATVVDSLRRAYPGQVLLVDSGDLIQGDPFAAYFARVAPQDTNPMIRAMNLVGYDAATLGNHEFNWGLATLAKALGGARFPYVSANIRGLPRDTLMHAPFVVLQREGIKVGIAGFTTPGVMVWDRKNVANRVRLERIPAAARRVLPQLDRQSDFDIVLIHSGMDGESSYDTTGVGIENAAAMLATMPSKPDLVVVGHSHREMRDSVINGVHFIQPKNWAQSVVVMHVDLVRGAKGWTPARWHADLVPLANVPPSPRLVAALEGAHDSVRAWVRQPLATAAAAMPLAMARTRPTPIIEFIQSVQKEVTGAQLSAAAAFNLEGGFPAGAVRLSDVASIYPYENTLRAVRISGAQLKAYLERSAEYYQVDSAGHVKLNPTMPGYNFDMVSGASYIIDLSKPVGSRIRDLTVRGKPVGPRDSFTMAVNSHRQEGGGGYTMLKGAPVTYDKGENIRDLLAEHLRTLGTIDSARYSADNWRIEPPAMAAEVAAVQRQPGAKSERRQASHIVLRILTTNDLHGALATEAKSWTKGREVGGLPVLESMMDSAEAECDCPVLQLDGGDEMQGTLESNLVFGRSMVDALNLLGLDAAAVGNHDFDWGIDTLRARMRQAHYPWLLANVYDSAVGGRPEWARPWAMLHVDTLDVAVIGYITDITKSIVRADNVKGLAFPGGAAALAGVLDTVHAQHPDLVVIVAHAGAVCDSTRCQGEIMDLARDLPRGSVDAIVAGHTHRLNNMMVNGIPIVQARSSGTALGVMDLVQGDSGLSWRTEVRDTWADEVTPDSAEVALVATFKARTDTLASRQIAVLADSLVRTSHDGQYPLGNLLADAQRVMGHADVAIMNNGGIRADLPAGPVSYRQLFELQPFGNNLVVARVTGRQLREALEYSVRGGSAHVHVSGVTMTFDPRKPDGQRLVKVLVAGKPLRDNATYTLAVNDFMSTGGDGFTMFNALTWRTTGMTCLDALVAWLQKQPAPVRADETVRIVPVNGQPSTVDRRP